MKVLINGSPGKRQYTIALNEMVKVFHEGASHWIAHGQQGRKAAACYYHCKEHGKYIRYT